ncbi:hypothetical protein CDIK_1744 [Cucumispora dikerogammari]|nr:hypothetical protein CDIK_1744 [Cucumispora dikerogammari]
MRRNYRRLPAETRESIIVPTHLERNLSLIGAINGERVLCSVVINRGGKAQDFKLFLLAFCQYLQVLIFVKVVYYFTTMHPFTVLKKQKRLFKKMTSGKNF